MSNTFHNYDLLLAQGLSFSLPVLLPQMPCPKNKVDLSQRLAIRCSTEGSSNSVAFMSQQRYVVYYTGEVQGVGFRYTVCRLAENFEVTGFVRNLPDGRVQLIAEGPTEELDRFLAAVFSQMAQYIRKQNLDKQEPTGQFSSFGLHW